METKAKMVYEAKMFVRLALLSSLGRPWRLASTAVLIALRYRRDPSTRRAVLMGIALGAAIMVKALVLPAAVPVGLILL